jgi:hypothetical protein
MKYNIFICFKQKNVQRVSTLYAETNQLLVKTEIKVLLTPLTQNTRNTILLYKLQNSANLFQFAQFLGGCEKSEM